MYLSPCSDSGEQARAMQIPIAIGLDWTQHTLKAMIKCEHIHLAVIRRPKFETKIIEFE